MKKILGLGNALVDALIQIDNDNIFKELSLCKEGMTLIKESTHKKIANRLKSLSFKRSNGGSAGNALSCIAALGGDASFVGRIGADENGAFYEAESKQRGVKFIPLRDPSLPTGVEVCAPLPLISAQLPCSRPNISTLQCRKTWTTFLLRAIWCKTTN